MSTQKRLTKELIGTRALITGSTAGIGKATALRLADEGVTHIAINGRSAERLDEVARLLEEKGVVVSKHIVDLSDKAKARQMVKDIIADFGGLDIVINNAGASYNQSFLNISDRILDLEMNANFLSGFVITQEAVKWMQENGVQGVVMFTAALAEYGGLPHEPIYAAAKAAMINLVKSISVTLAPYGIRAIAVSPGFTNTMSMDRDGDAEAKHVRSVLPKVMPLGRMADPEDIAGVFAFLCTHDANYITGVNIVVDGAVTADSVSVPWLPALQGRLSEGPASYDKELDPNSERARAVQE